jgi:predicted DCC family thiol-disulfide oxidoreductase YuxK
MKTLTLHYDARCGLCTALCGWIARQPQLVPLACVPKDDAAEDLEVVADTGEVWSGDDAWLIVLWALTEYRHWSYRLASPALKPTARAMFATLSKYRGAVSCALGLSPESA